jgi:hypothetical protein
VPEFDFPPDGQPVDPSWWAPLEAIGRIIAGDPRYRFFDIADFMVMGKLKRRAPQPALLMYKHVHTRAYLHLDEAGHAYRYVAPPDLTRGSGRHLRHRDLHTALDALRLWELPWMTDSLAHHRQGLRWEERWRLRDELDALAANKEVGDHGRRRVV